MAVFQSWEARLQSAVMLRSASQISLLAASSEGKWPRVLMILRSCAFTLSIELVAQITRRTAGGKAKNGITFDHARRQEATTVGNFCPQGPPASE